jgi:hypothetical protein
METKLAILAIVVLFMVGVLVGTILSHRVLLDCLEEKKVYPKEYISFDRTSVIQVECEECAEPVKCPEPVKIVLEKSEPETYNITFVHCTGKVLGEVYWNEENALCRRDTNGHSYRNYLTPESCCRKYYFGPKCYDMVGTNWREFEKVRCLG